MRHHISTLIAACLLLYSPLFSQNDLPPKVASPFTVRQIHSGHSLTDPLFNPWPGQFVRLVGMETGAWAGDHIGKSTIPGSPIFWRWQHSTVPDARLDIQDWELLSITERVPVYYAGGSTQQWYIDAIDSQRIDLSRFVNHAWTQGNGGNGASTLLWTTWTNIDNSDGPWRAMLDVQGQEWENMQDYANAHRPVGAPPVYLIPGHRMMARLYDDIELGLVPGVSNIAFFFGDNIHVNDFGAYAVALIHYACIFNKSPIGLTNDLVNSGNTNYPTPTPALAAYLQRMIWEVVTSYPRTGVRLSTPVAALPEAPESHILSAFPNPARGKLSVKMSLLTPKSPAFLSLSNVQGQIVYDRAFIQGHTSDLVEIPISMLENGWYLLRLESEGKVVTERILIAN